jgi:two-component system cell cycle sensor histidine kinase/response regulator CckA
VVKQFGGFITVDSRPGKGTTFVILLPRLTKEPTRPRQSDRIPVPGGNQCVLVVDDEHAVLRVVSRVLKRAGYLVLSCADSSAAVALVRDRGLTPDILVTDVVMPELSGPELAIELRASFPSMRVILASGYSDIDLDEASLPKGSIMLHKPFTPKTLLSKVHEALAQRVGQPDGVVENSDEARG